ncbi:MAG TPA: DUF2878 family protein [bacterium]|nr:DUF2878 family protein [bacterium]
MKTWSLLLLRFAAYQAAWFGIVLGAANGRGVPGIAIGAACAAAALALEPAESRLRLAGGLAGLTLFGIAAESMLGIAGLARWAAPSAAEWACPPWLAGMWLFFAAAGTPLFRALRGRAPLAVLAGALGGPAAYASAARLGAAALAGWPALLALAVIWAAALPLAAFLLGGERASGGRAATS